mgnify:CR=1 FL=1
MKMDGISGGLEILNGEKLYKVLMGSGLRGILSGCLREFTNISLSFSASSSRNCLLLRKGLRLERIL